MAASPSQKPSVFISYAHKDGMDFTRRLAFALGMYVDVFWDRHLQTGEYPTQLYEEIKSRDYFLLVMSPYSLREHGWCRKELAQAQRHNNDGIMLAHIYEECCDPDLGEKYTWGDFTKNFEEGFRRLTAMILGQPRSSWEYLVHETDDALIGYLKIGLVPGLIARSVAEWVIVDRLWPFVESYMVELEKEFGAPIFARGTPRTPMGILRQCPPLVEQFARMNDSIGVVLIRKARKIVEAFVNQSLNTQNNNHERAGEIVYNLIMSFKKMLERGAGRNLDAINVIKIQRYFEFDTAEKIRELINIHARRSRYLY